LHVTLCFLGYHPERAVERISEIIGASRRAAVPMRFERDPVPLPRSRPRLFAVGAESEASVALQAEVAEALEAERFYRPEKREFWPHVTVARVRPERRPSGSSRDLGGSSGRPGGSRGRRGKPEPVERPPGPLPEALCEPFGAVRLALYRSILRPQGAEYVSLASVDLAPAKGDSKR
jgi:2'-5' RNA ligase